MFKTNKETSELVSAGFLRLFTEAQLANNLLQVHSDSSSVLRGVRSGAIVKISREAPQIKFFDIGGDGLHHVHNAHNQAAKPVFIHTLNVAKNVKLELRVSSAKVELFQNICRTKGEKPTKPIGYCQSRWLSLAKLVRFVLEHLDSLQEYYAQATST